MLSTPPLSADTPAPSPYSKLGLAIQTLGQQPINAMRVPATGDTNGWYLWCGEQFSDADDFFVPLHVSHLPQYLPLVQPYLHLPPGYRFIIDNDGYQDIWFDENLLTPVE